jgi:hypothetical protein
LGVPEDEDFWYAIQEFATNHGAVLPKTKRNKAAWQRSMFGKLMKAVVSD